VEDHCKLDSDLLPDREPMVWRIPESEEAELYNYYTINALHVPREIESLSIVSTVVY